MDLDVIIEVDSRAPPFRELPILCRQAVERGALDLLEQFTPAQAEMAHGALVHALHDKRDGLVAFGEREEGLRAQSPEDIGLSKSDAGLDLRLVSWLVRPRWKDSNRVVRRHRAVGSVDFGIVERSLVDAALQIVGDQQFRDAAEETEHAHMRAGPIRQLLRPGRLGISQVRSPKHADKYLRFVDFACRRINNRDPLARVVHERLFSGDVVLPHHRAQPSLEPAKQIAEPAVAVALLVDLPIFLPKDHHRHARPLQLARQGRPIRLDPTPLAGLDSRAPEQPQLQGVVGHVIRQRPRQSRRCRPFQIVLDRRPRHAQTSPDLARAHPAMVKSQQMSQLSHAQFPLRRHPHLLVDHRQAGSASVADSRGADAEPLTGSGGRLHFGMVAGFKSERWPASNRNRWPDCVGIRTKALVRRPSCSEPCCRANSSIVSGWPALS